MSTFWTIFFFVINLILGAIIAIACASIGKWCKRLVNAETSWKRGEAESKISGWLWALAATIIIIFTISAVAPVRTGEQLMISAFIPISSVSGSSGENPRMIHSGILMYPQVKGKKSNFSVPV